MDGTAPPSRFASWNSILARVIYQFLTTSDLLISSYMQEEAEAEEEEIHKNLLGGGWNRGFKFMLPPYSS